MTKFFLLVSLAGFAFGLTGLFYGLGAPVGAIFLGLFLISRILEKETTLYDQEQRQRLLEAIHAPQATEQKQAPSVSHTRLVPAAASNH